MAAVPDTEQYMKRCMCGGCPSFPGDGGFYCAKGKEFGLTKGYYCADGSAAAIDA